MILVIDNYDSFVHNLARYFRRLGCETKVVRNDQITVEQIGKLQPQSIVLSPGPCGPDEAGICLEVVERLKDSVPILGICLGHQAIIQALGGTIQRANTPMHGRYSDVVHQSSPMFDRIPSPFRAGRYHSLIAAATRIPDSVQVTARTADGIVMAIEHRSAPVVGLQFHPESILTECGFRLLANFLRVAKIETPTLDLATLDDMQQRECVDAQQFRSRPYPRSPRLSQREAT